MSHPVEDARIEVAALNLAELIRLRRENTELRAQLIDSQRLREENRRLRHYFDKITAAVFDADQLASQQASLSAKLFVSTAKAKSAVLDGAAEELKPIWESAR